MPGFRTMCGRPEQYEDVNVLSAQMQDYFEEKGGTCTIIDENP